MIGRSTHEADLASYTPMRVSGVLENIFRELHADKVSDRVRQNEKNVGTFYDRRLP
jgi:hypothetical protein